MRSSERLIGKVWFYSWRIVWGAFLCAFAFLALLWLLVASDVFQSFEQSKRFQEHQIRHIVDSKRTNHPKKESDWKQLLLPQGAHEVSVTAAIRDLPSDCGITINWRDDHQQHSATWRILHRFTIFGIVRFDQIVAENEDAQKVTPTVPEHTSYYYLKR